jgi:hypothetical protein
MRRRSERSCSKLPACPAQESQLGGIAPTPNAVKQMKPDSQAAWPRKLGIHGLGYEASDMSAVQHAWRGLLLAWMGMTRGGVLIRVGVCVRTNALQGIAARPSARDAASPRGCSATDQNPYRFPLRAPPRSLGARKPAPPWSAIATGNVGALPGTPC